ncbi:MAG: LacI family DNA-binding transcriptional regulator [Anaerolineae bacterium]|nr:LacI family DNA-binding transcriptional regulator [Anaerolineae bacterium]MBN8618703.1 LacI family DNA-binding transcriptional regulator [Anaerolineae bacterium]
MNEIDNDSFQKSHKNVTIIDVARASGVSYSTVSRVLNGYEFVKEDTRQRVLEAAEKLGYVANLQARSLAGGHSNIIGVLVPGLDNSYIGEIIRGVDEELARANYDLMLYTTHRQRGHEQRYVNTIANGLTDGLLLVVPEVPTDYLKALSEKSFPHVLIDQSNVRDSSSMVDSTNWQGAYDATRYLIELGHRRIGFITGMMELSSAGERLDGYRAALTDHSIPFLPELVAPGDFWQRSGHKSGLQLLDLPAPPTAIFASNDLMAFGLMEAIRERNLSVPEDISIVGFDDIPQSSIVYPPLTTVRQPLDQMGRVAARLLLEQIENPDRPPRRVTLATQLIIRESCAALKERG